MKENLDVRCIPFKVRKDLTFQLSGKCYFIVSSKDFTYFAKINQLNLGMFIYIHGIVKVKFKTKKISNKSATTFTFDL